MTDPQEWLAAASIDDAVFALRPDYRALLVTADGLRGADSEEVSERVLAAAEATARERLDGRKPEERIFRPTRAVSRLYIGNCWSSSTRTPDLVLTELLADRFRFVRSRGRRSGHRADDAGRAAARQVAGEPRLVSTSWRRSIPGS